MNYQQPEISVTYLAELIKDDNVKPYYKIKNFYPGSITATCPSCNVYAFLQIDTYHNKKDKKNKSTSPEEQFNIVCSCPKCDQVIFINTTVFGPTIPANYSKDFFYTKLKGYMINVYPSYKDREIVISEDIPEMFRKDYYVAQKSLEISPRLTNIMARAIIEKFIKSKYPELNKKHLNDCIPIFVKKEEEKGQHLPPNLMMDLDHIRLKGNEAAHANLSQEDIVKLSQGDIAEESQEDIAEETQEDIAEDGNDAALFNLRLLSDLFNFYYIHPAERERNYHKNADRSKKQSST